jgi:arginine decarboxylase
MSTPPTDAALPVTPVTEPPSAPASGAPAPPAPATPAPSTPPAAPASAPWTIERAKQLYNIEGWGDGFFDVNDQGHMVVRPDRDHPDRVLDLYEVAHDLEAQGVGLPVLLRFSDILRSRIEMLHNRFSNAIAEFQYEGKYTTVYPIKVNQQRHVVEEIVEFGHGTGVGLECGSKPELQAVLALTERADHLIICNGYKDEEFMRLALMGQKLGHTVLIVIEQVSELDVLLPVAAEMGIVPTIGVRIKLSSEGSGRWAQSGGEK